MSLNAVLLVLRILLLPFDFEIKCTSQPSNSLSNAVSPRIAGLAFASPKGLTSLVYQSDLNVLLLFEILSILTV